MDQRHGFSAAQNASAAVPERRYYLLAHGMLGLPTLPLYLRTLGGTALLLGAPPLAARLLGRLGARDALHRLERLWARAVRRYLGVHLELAGLERIDRSQAYLVIALHESLVDAIALLHLPLKQRFVVRDEIFAWRYLGPVLRDTGQLEVCPERGMLSYRRLLRMARAVLAADESLTVFPQGSILGIETSFMLGTFRLAQALRRPILPVALSGGHRVWEYPYTPLLRYGQRVSLRVLPPIPAAEVLARDPRELRLDVQRRLKAAVLAGDMAPPRRFVPARDGYWDGYAYSIDPDFAELAEEIARHRSEQKSGPPL